MRFLSVRQPWADAIARGWKVIENRKQAPPRSVLSQQVAIHAALSWGLTGSPGDILPNGRTVRRNTCARGGVVAVATVVGYGWTEEQLLRLASYDELRWWQRTQVGIVLRDVKRIRQPVPVRGMLGWPELPPDVEAAILAQI